MSMKLIRLQNKVAQKAGIAVGVIALVVVVGAGAFVYKKRQQNIRRAQFGPEVHSVTQQAEPSKEEPRKAYEVPSRIKRIKEKDRNKLQLEDYVYIDTNLRKGISIKYLEGGGKEKCTEPKRTLKLRSKRENYECGRHLLDETFTTITTLYKNLGDSAPIWEKDIKKVSVKDIVNVLEGNPISHKVVTGFSILLRENQEKENNFLIFPANALAFCEKCEKEGKTGHFLERLLKETFQKYERIYFPICCKGLNGTSYHWILLTFEPGVDGDWKMYNSLNSNKIKTEAFKKQCAKMQKYIWKCFYTIDADKKLKQKEKAKAIQVIEDNPKQDTDRANCAVYVMYYIHQLANKMKINRSWKAEEVQEFTAFIVNSICLNRIYR